MTERNSLLMSVFLSGMMLALIVVTLLDRQRNPAGMSFTFSDGEDYSDDDYSGNVGSYGAR